MCTHVHIVHVCAHKEEKIMKIRLHGSLHDTENFIGLLKYLEEKYSIEILNISKKYKDRGESKYYRTYIDVAQKEKK